ncbi:glycosyl transferase [Alicyclobacillus hesperidum]|uniref:Glycosyl transferase n=1 Tax=Alicyclobacillus hesperidum TaxID=89784 RepID=A0AA37U9T6_9BACL|nr:glycosyltransferase [Alicyclobacillus hesperidum]GLV14188.1 glycosyl transferase [Alicyclobacillus hesperidum]
MRIYFYSLPLAGRGGMETVLKQVVSEMRNMGHDVTTILMQPPHSDRSWRNELGSVVYAERRAHGIGGRFEGENGIISAILDLQDVLRELPCPDVLVAMAPWAVAIARAAMGVFQTKSVRLVSWIHNSLHVYSERNLIAYADAHLAISTGILEQVKQLDPSKPVKLVYNPVKTSSVNVIARAATPTFIYVGRLDLAQKRLDVLFNALSRLRHHEWKLKVIGDVVVESADTRAAIENLVDGLKIKDRIEWFGWRTDPWAVVSEATALLLTSDWEGFALVLVEALARGVPVVSTNCFSGPADIVVPGVNGWLTEPGNAEQLAGVLEGILNGSTKLPNSQACIDSAAKFDHTLVVEEIVSALFHYKMHL